MKFFANLHPVVLFAHFIVVLGLIMFTMNPILIGVSFLGAVIFAWSSEGLWMMRKVFIFAGFLIVVVSVTNPLFTHNGVTALFFIFGRVFTLEALYYGITAGFMLASVFIWCRVYSNVITSDKFLYLFGKFLPKLSLVLSMSLRFIPLFVRKIKTVNEVQRTMGLYSAQSMTDRFLSGARVFSAVLTWSLENAVDTANSMKARGYGLPGRSAFSLFRFTRRDGLMLGLITVLAFFSYGGVFSGALEFYFYPVLAPFTVNYLSLSSIFSSAVIMFLPTAIESIERILWNFYISKI